VMIGLACRRICSRCSSVSSMGGHLLDVLRSYGKQP
jgi:hypothetical protein